MKIDELLRQLPYYPAPKGLLRKLEAMTMGDEKVNAGRRYSRNFSHEERIRFHEPELRHRDPFVPGLCRCGCGARIGESQPVQGQTRRPRP